jgi:hypothetical protein
LFIISLSFKLVKSFNNNIEKQKEISNFTTSNMTRYGNPDTGLTKVEKGKLLTNKETSPDSLVVKI